MGNPMMEQPGFGGLQQQFNAGADLHGNMQGNSM